MSLNSISTRLSKLEEKMATDDTVTFVVCTGEDAQAKQSQAWQDYLSGGGTQEYAKTLFVQINKVIKS